MTLIIALLQQISDCFGAPEREGEYKRRTLHAYLMNN